jgi:hypothetical protein
VLDEHGEEWDAHAFVIFDGALERGCLDELEPDVQTDEDEHGARKERDAEAVVEHLLGRHPLGDHEKNARRAQEADGRAELRKHAVERLFSRRRVLRGEEHCAAPFAAEPESLPQAAEREQDGREQANRRVRRKQSDGDGRDAHRQERGDQRRLAAHAVAEVPEQRGAHGPREERERKRGERLQRRRGRVRRRKEQLRKHQDRGGGVDVEVEELDGGADQAREEHAPR